MTTTTVRARWLLVPALGLLGGLWIASGRGGTGDRVAAGARQGGTETSRRPSDLAVAAVAGERARAEHALGAAREDAQGRDATLIVEAVHGDLGVAAAGVRVTVRDPGSCTGHGANTDARGRATFRLSPGRWIVYGLATEIVDVETVAGEERTVVLRVDRDLLPFHLLVVDAATGRPIEGARLEWQYEREANTSDATGALATSVKAGRSGVLRHPHYGPAHVLGEPDHETHERALTVVLQRAGALSGTVRDAERPLGGVLVRAEVRSESLGGRLGEHDEARTDDEGTYTLAGLASGVPIDLWFLGEGWSQLHDVRLATGEERRLDVVVGAGARLFGRLAGHDGLPIPERTLELWRGGAVRVGRGSPETTARTALDGGFAFDGVPPGTWTLALEPPEDGLEVAPLEPAVVQIDADALEREVALATYPPLYVAGRCQGPDGEPVAFAELGLAVDGALAASGFSAEDGAFTLGPVRRGAVEVVAISCPRGLLRPPRFSVQAGRWDVVVRYSLDPASEKGR